MNVLAKQAKPIGIVPIIQQGSLVEQKALDFEKDVIADGLRSAAIHWFTPVLRTTLSCNDPIVA